MITFRFGGLSPTMLYALSWLVDQGGSMPHPAFVLRVRIASKAAGLLVTRATIRGLTARGYLDDSPDFRAVQVTGWTILEARCDPRNPPMMPILRARAEPLARQEHADRTADMIKAAWANRNNPTTTESDNV